MKFASGAILLTLVLVQGHSLLDQDCEIAGRIWREMDGYWMRGCCSRPTILCKLSRPQRIIGLYWNGRGLKGPIPPEIGNLTALQELSLSNNQLSGPIPESIGNLKSLKKLWLYNNQLTGDMPMAISNLNQLSVLQLNDNKLHGSIPDNFVVPKRLLSFLFLGTNRFKRIPFHIATATSIWALSNETVTLLLNTQVRKSKRQVVTTTAPISTDELIKMCPLNNVTNADVPAGCVAGIYNTYCYNPGNAVLLGQCHAAYNRAFSASFFKSIGDVCPAWKRGPRSSNCALAISVFSYNLVTGQDPKTGQDIILKLNSQHASQLVSTIFASRTYAPCVAPFACYW